jgi:hypothetical protein
MAAEHGLVGEDELGPWFVVWIEGLIERWVGFCELQLRIGRFGFDVTEQPWVLVCLQVMELD